MIFIGSVLIGIISGFIVGKLTKTSGFGIILNLIAGIAGSLLGSWVSLSLLAGTYNLPIYLLMSSLGAIALIWIILISEKVINKNRTV